MSAVLNELVVSTGVAIARLRFIEPTPHSARWLRRFSFREPDFCLDNGEWGHDAWVAIEDGVIDGPVDRRYRVNDRAVSSIDSRWPTHCSCGYEFTPHDQWQCHRKRLFSSGDFGAQLFPLENAPVGAVYRTDWLGRRFFGPDGHSLTIVLPTGPWCVDAPRDQGGPWYRQGRVEDGTLCITPTVRHGGFEGYVYNGILYEGTLDWPEDTPLPLPPR